MLSCYGRLYCVFITSANWVDLNTLNLRVLYICATLLLYTVEKSVKICTMYFNIVKEIVWILEHYFVYHAAQAL